MGGLEKEADSYLKVRDEQRVQFQGRPSLKDVKGIPNDKRMERDSCKYLEVEINIRNEVKSIIFINQL